MFSSGLFLTFIFFISRESIQIIKLDAPFIHVILLSISNVYSLLLSLSASAFETSAYCGMFLFLHGNESADNPGSHNTLQIKKQVWLFCFEVLIGIISITNFFYCTLNSNYNYLIHIYSTTP